jgi:hypothetical protein
MRFLLLVKDHEKEAPERPTGASEASLPPPAAYDGDRTLTTLHKVKQVCNLESRREVG